MSQQSLAQRRATHAFGCVKEHIGKSYGNYVNYVERLPATILMNGLGQACATLLSKAKKEDDVKNRDSGHLLLYKDLERWLCGSDDAVPYRGSSNLIEAIIHRDQESYLRAQAEALAYLVWLKKFANAYLQKGENDE